MHPPTENTCAKVSKEHLSKVQQQRIAEEDLLFDGMEPAFSSMAQFGNSGMVGFYYDYSSATSAVAMTCLSGVLWGSLYRRCLMRAYSTQLAPVQPFTCASDLAHGRQMLSPRHRLGKIKACGSFTSECTSILRISINFANKLDMHEHIAQPPPPAPPTRTQIS